MKIFYPIVLSTSLFVSSCGMNSIQEPEYRDIRNIHLVQLGPLQSTAGLDIVYYNPNSFGVEVASANGEIFIDNNYFGSFDLNDKVEVRKRSEFTLPALVKIDMIGVLKQHDIFKKTAASVKIEGTAKLKKAGFSKDVPIEYETTQDLQRFRSLISPDHQQQ